MNKKTFTPLWVVALIALVTFTSCAQTENSNELEIRQTSYHDLYQQFQNALKSSESITDLQQKETVLYTKMKKWDWHADSSTRSASDMSFDEQREYLQEMLSPQALHWVKYLQNSFVSGTNNISVEQITTDNILTENEKRMLVAILAGGHYLQEMILTTQTRNAANCYAQYQKDCERALQVYAISGSVGAIGGGFLGLAGATALCALQLSWAEDDYKECLAK